MADLAKEWEAATPVTLQEEWDKAAPLATSDTKMAVTKEEIVPEWGRKNPNLYGVYGAGRALLRTGIEGAGTALGAAGGALTPVPGASLAGAGLGYATSKRGADYALSSLDKLVGSNVEPTPEPDSIKQFGKDVALGALLQGAGNVVGKGIGVAVPQKAIDYGYRSAMKFNRGMAGITPEEVEQSVRTGLKYGAVPSEDVGFVQRMLGFKGRNQLLDTLDHFENKVTSIIDELSAQGKTVSSRDVATRLDALLQKGDRIFKSDADYKNAVQAVKDQLLKGDDAIPAADAQEMKRHIYKTFEDYYGSSTAHKATVEAQKGVARGYKEELEALAPNQLKPLNAEYGDLVEFLDPFNRALTRVGRRDLMTVGASTATSAGRAMAGSAGAKVALPVKILEAPSLKSRAAILLDRGKNLPKSALRDYIGKGVAPVSAAMSDASPDTLRWWLNQTQVQPEY